MAHFANNPEELPLIGSDYSELEGTCCYCSAESAGRIRGSIAGLPLEAIHLIGTGDYHYISLFWAERIVEDFALVLFDNHPDDQPGAFGDDMLSCGSWVADVRSLPRCKHDVWIRDAGTAADLPAGLPVYISVDLDVLSPEYARTDWDQGSMTLEGLCSALSALGSSHRIIGADICGGITEAQGGTEADAELNRTTAAAVASALRRSI